MIIETRIIMRSVMEKDKQRKKDLEKLGWKLIIIHRKNFKFLDKITQAVKNKYE